MEDAQSLIFERQLDDIKEAIEKGDLETSKQYRGRSYYLGAHGEVIRALLDNFENLHGNVLKK